MKQSFFLLCNQGQRKYYYYFRTNSKKEKCYKIHLPFKHRGNKLEIKCTKWEKTEIEIYTLT